MRDFDRKLTSEYSEKIEEVDKLYRIQYIQLEEEYKQYIKHVEEKSKLQINEIIIAPDDKTETIAIKLTKAISAV